MAATSVNLNGHLCATGVDLAPLKVHGGREVACIAKRGGSATKSEVIDTGTSKANAS